jgi:GNAT superfamily N-acetyltransferase
MLTTVRHVLPYEYWKYRWHLKQLDDESKILRFGYRIPDDIIDNLCDRFESDPARHLLFAVENDRFDFIGIGHIALDVEMELAFSVLKPYQGQGLGNSLMSRCLQWCRTHDILEGSMICMNTNGAIKHLCNKHGITMTIDHGEILARIKLDQPSLVTYVSEAADDHLSVINYLGKRMFWPLGM